MRDHRQHLGSASAAAMVASFGRYGSRIAFAPETGAGGGKSDDKKEEGKDDAAKKDGAKPDAVKKDAAKKDEGTAAPSDDKLDRLLSLMDVLGTKLDSTSARVDAMEKARDDGAAKADGAKKDEMSQPSKEERETSERQSATETEQEKERDKQGVGDAAKKDAEDDKDKGDKNDAAKADSVDLSRYERDMADIRARMPRALTDAEERDFAAAQARADSVFNLHGKRASAPMSGETLMAYRVRLARDHQRFSGTFKDSDLRIIAAADPKTYGAIEDRIYADSAVAANNPTDIEAGTLREIVTRNPMTDRVERTFRGPSTFIKAMEPPVKKYLRGFERANAA